MSNRNNEFGPQEIADKVWNEHLDIIERLKGKWPDNYGEVHPLHLTAVLAKAVYQGIFMYAKQLTCESFNERYIKPKADRLDKELLGNSDIYFKSPEDTLATMAAIAQILRSNLLAFVGTERVLRNLEKEANRNE